MGTFAQNFKKYNSLFSLNFQNGNYNFIRKVFFTSWQATRRSKTHKIISDLWYDKSIEMVLFRNQLLDRNVSDIINLHEYAAEFGKTYFSIWFC
jgi:hypothetical protein